MTSLTEIAAILGLAFGATVLTFLTGIGMATLADWSIERRMRAIRSYNENKESR